MKLHKQSMNKAILITEKEMKETIRKYKTLIGAGGSQQTESQPAKH